MISCLPSMVSTLANHLCNICYTSLDASHSVGQRPTQVQPEAPALSSRCKDSRPRQDASNARASHELRTETPQVLFLPNVRLGFHGTLLPSERMLAAQCSICFYPLMLRPSPCAGASLSWGVPDSADQIQLLHASRSSASVTCNGCTVWLCWNRTEYRNMPP